MGIGFAPSQNIRLLVLLFAAIVAVSVYCQEALPEEKSHLKVAGAVATAASDDPSAATATDAGSFDLASEKGTGHEHVIGGKPCVEVMATALIYIMQELGGSVYKSLQESAVQDQLQALAGSIKRQLSEIVDDDSKAALMMGAFAAQMLNTRASDITVDEKKQYGSEYQQLQQIQKVALLSLDEVLVGRYETFQDPAVQAKFKTLSDEVQRTLESIKTILEQPATDLDRQGRLHRRGGFIVHMGLRTTPYIFDVLEALARGLWNTKAVISSVAADGSRIIVPLIPRTALIYGDKALALTLRGMGFGFLKTIDMFSITVTPVFWKAVAGVRWAILNTPMRNEIRYPGAGTQVIAPKLMNFGGLKGEVGMEMYILFSFLFLVILFEFIILVDRLS